MRTSSLYILKRNFSVDEAIGIQNMTTKLIEIILIHNIVSQTLEEKIMCVYVSI